MKFIIPLLGILTTLTLSPRVEGREVQVQLEAGWAQRAVHPLAEVAEFLADQAAGDKDFWSFVESLCASPAHSAIIDKAATATATTTGSVTDVSTDVSMEYFQNVSHLALTVGGQIVPSNVQSILEASSTLGMYRPAVQFYESLTSPADAPCGAGNAYVVKYPGGVVECSPHSTKSRDFNTAASTTLTDETVNMPWNHEFPFGSEKSVNSYGHSEVQVLYGIIGSSSFCELHARLSAEAMSGSKRYIARHAFAGTSEMSSHRAIQGYGVFLDIKNMEYRNADESKGPENDQTNGDKEADEEDFVFDQDEEVEGVVFSTLQSRYPHLTKELKIAREELQAKAEASSDSSEMKMWKVLDLGLQTTQSIVAASASPSTTDSVTAMNNFLHNFPKHASSLSTVRVNEKLKDTVMHYYRSGAMQGIPINSLFINGLRIDLSAATLNIFDIISNIRQELKNSDYLSRKGVSADVKKELLRHAAGLTSGAASTATTREEQMMEFVKSIKRVDVSKGGRYAIQFLNNLEKDSQYKRLPKSVTTLLQPSWQLTGLSRNIYTLVAVVNPVSVEGASMLFQVNQIYEQQYPVRVGIVWACDAPLSLAAREHDAATAEDVCRLYGEAKNTYGPKAALAVVSRITSMIEEEAEDKFEPSSIAAEGSIATSSPQAAIFVTKEQAAELYADAIAAFKKEWTSKNDFYEEAVTILNEKKGTDFVSNTTSYLAQRGLPANSFSLNGIVQESDDIMTYLMQLLGREQQILSILVSMKKVTDKSKSIFNSILKASPTFSRYHSLIEEVNPDYIDTSGQDYMNLEMSIANMFDSKVLSQHECGVPTDEISDSKLFNTTVIAVPVHNEFGLRSLQSALTWFLEAVPTFSDDASMTCQADLDMSTGGQRLGVVLRAPSGGAPIHHLHRMAILATLLQSKEAHSIYVLKDVVNLLLEDSNLHDILQQLKITYKNENNVPEARVLEEVVAMLSLIGDDPNKVVEVLEGKLSLSTNVLQASAHAGRAFESTDAEDVVLHFNARKLVVSAMKGTPLHALDIAMLVNIEHPRLGEPLGKTMTDHGKMVPDGTTVPFTGEDFLFLASYCGRYAATGGNRADVMGVMEEAGIAVEGSHEGRVPSNQYVFHVEGESQAQDVDLVFVVHPLTIAGQRSAALIKLIQEQLHLSQTVILVPQMELSEFPLQNFFRFVAPTSGASTLSGVFKKLPRQHTLTVRIDTPEAWNVQTFAAEQDIDNLKCSKNKCGDTVRTGETSKEISRVSYLLKNIAIAGQCYEGWAVGRPNPPNGLQIVLNQALSPLSSIRHDHDANETNKQRGNDADTLVMKNLGYYQLQANPGLWQLGLAEGRAASLYTLDDAQRQGQESMWIPVLSFTSAMHQLFVTKRPGMESLSLLDEEGDDNQAPDQGMWTKLSAQVQGLWGKSEEKALVPADDEDNRIHIFSLATGQVYERLLRIMMLSATKRTSVPIKFWLFEYYLSPAFKATVEAMAAKYNFEVGYVVYKWPEWLNQQTEKQRIIWGYKILFLDVLFPLNVKKVIYVDADQVVRADLKELWDMDLEGKPYAYTPFCDSREETLGFQFWRQGYWADHLRGKPYHISALYVVDLQVFRRRAVGDSLRAVYDQLSKDPNSLSNLDQDLPNYAQHIVPIHSLPQEWLWCESWCSDKTKETAKTIDLCNNPRYKEPKLDMAKRVISGELFPESWVELDEEIKATILQSGMTVEY